jgi:hypothetical protein
MPLFCLFFIFYHIHTFIQYIYPSPFAEASLHFLIACMLSGGTPPCGAEPRIELGPALQQADACRNKHSKSFFYSRNLSSSYARQLVHLGPNSVRSVLYKHVNL